MVLNHCAYLPSFFYSLLQQYAHCTAFLTDVGYSLPGNFPSATLHLVCSNSSTNSPAATHDPGFLSTSHRRFSSGSELRNCSIPITCCILSTLVFPFIHFCSRSIKRTLNSRFVSPSFLFSVRNLFLSSLLVDVIPGQNRIFNSFIFSHLRYRQSCECQLCFSRQLRSQIMRPTFLFHLVMCAAIILSKVMRYDSMSSSSYSVTSFTLSSAPDFATGCALIIDMRLSICDCIVSMVRSTSLSLLVRSATASSSRL